MQILQRIPYWIALALLIYMPFHIFLSQSLSLTTGGLEMWKVAKDVLLGLAALFTICLVFVQRQGNRLFYWLLGLTAAYFGLHLALWAAHPGLFDKSAVLGTIYNSRLPALLLLGYGAALLNKDKFVFSSILKIVIGASSLVALLGVVQYLLPKDVLTHFGYSLDRGVRPAFFIDDKAGLPRIMSTLREPNALGAYLLVPMAALTALIIRVRQSKQRWLLGGLLALHTLALLLTFSRSAWLAAGVVMGLVAWWQFSSPLVRYLKRWWLVAVAILFLVAIVGLAQRDNQFVASYITHSTPEVVEDLDSNQYHWLFVRQGIEGVIAQPFGHGPGTAGIVSIQNPEGSFLTENYYVQVGYEVGVLGLALFITLSALVYARLRARRDYVAAVLLASFWGYVITNMLLHTWSNEAVATQWWLLAGLALLLPRAAVKRSAGK